MAPAVTTVVYAHGGGRFGNQFLRFAHWLAWAMECENRTRIIDLAFWPYAPLFATWESYPGCLYPLQRSWIHSLARLRRWTPQQIIRHGEWRMERWIARGARRCPGVAAVALNDAAGEEMPLTPEMFRGGARAVVCSGWKFTAWAALERQENKVRALFKPAIEPAAISDAFVAALRQRYDILIGLFVRRGDYREWADGRYHYPWESYVRWIRDLGALYPGRRVGVVLTGDEALPLSLWAELPVVPATGSVNAGGIGLRVFWSWRPAIMLFRRRARFQHAPLFSGTGHSGRYGDPTRSCPSTRSCPATSSTRVETQSSRLLCNRTGMHGSVRPRSVRIRLRRSNRALDSPHAGRLGGLSVAARANGLAIEPGWGFALSTRNAQPTRHPRCVPGLQPARTDGPGVRADP